LPMDPLIEGRLKECLRAGEDLRTELTSILTENGAPSVTLARLQALVERFPRSSAATEALARAEQAGREANRGAVRERFAKAIATATRHEQNRKIRDAAQAWREALSLDPDAADAQEGIARTERRRAEFDAVLTQSKSLLAARDPEGAERTASEALAIVAGDPA